jgi:hypothetical protein
MADIKPTWTDLLIQEVPDDVTRRCLSSWPNLINGRVSVRFYNRLGDCFFAREDGSVHKLDVLAGVVSPVAPAEAAFMGLVNDQAWQEENLFSLEVFALHQSGLIASGMQCYALVPHPALTGTFSTEGAMVMDLPVWHHICAEMTQ